MLLLLVLLLLLLVLLLLLLLCPLAAAAAGLVTMAPHQHALFRLWPSNCEVSQVHAAAVATAARPELAAQCIPHWREGGRCARVCGVLVGLGMCCGGRVRGCVRVSVISLKKREDLILKKRDR
jgi:hypothetical protein